MTVDGIVLIDLTDAPEDRHRHRVAALADAPKGATVELVVGSWRVGPDTARIVRQYADDRDFHVIVKGTSFAVRNWIHALRTGDLCGVLL